jgi:ribosome-associated heat shock protein Hsp15
MAELSATGTGASLRLDKFLWYARIVKSRDLAQALAESGHLRIAGRVVDRAHAPVRIGDVLSFAIHGRVRVIRIESLPKRRGPSAEAQQLYSEIDSASQPDEGTADEASPAPPRAE